MNHERRRIVKEIKKGWLGVSKNYRVPSYVREGGPNGCGSGPWEKGPWKGFIKKTFETNRAFVARLVHAISRRAINGKMIVIKEVEMKNQLSYPAIFELDEDGIYTVEFPDLPGCLTEGSTKDEALFNAKEALTGYLAALMDREKRIPESSEKKGDNIHYIKPDYSVGFSLRLKLYRQTQNKTQKEFADMLKVSQPMYSKLENPDKCNPTLKTIQELEEKTGFIF